MMPFVGLIRARIFRGFGLSRPSRRGKRFDKRLPAAHRLIKQIVTTSDSNSLKENRFACAADSTSRP